MPEADPGITGPYVITGSGGAALFCIVYTVVLLDGSSRAG